MYHFLHNFADHRSEYSIDIFIVQHIDIFSIELEYNVITIIQNIVNFSRSQVKVIGKNMIMSFIYT